FGNLGHNWGTILASYSLSLDADGTEGMQGILLQFEISNLNFSIAVELMVSDAAAAHPAEPGSVFAGEAGRHEGGRAKQGNAFFRRQGSVLRRSGLLFRRSRSFLCRLFFRWRSLLFCWGKQADFTRRNGHELFVHQAGARHVAVERRPAFAEQPAKIHLGVKK